MCETFRMTELAAQAGTIPKWDTADRMRKALRHAPLGVAEMADYLQVDRSTISNWTSGRIEPSAQTLRLWAAATGAPFTWLCHGDLNPCDLRPRGVPGADSVTSLQVRRVANNMHYSQTSAEAA